MQGTRVSPSRPPSSPSPSSSAPPPPSQTVAKTSSPPPSSPSFLPPPSNTPYTYYIQPSYAIPYIPPGGVYTHQPPRQHALDQGIEGGGASSVPLLAPSSSSSHPSLSSDERDYRYFERRRTTPSMRNEGEDSQASSQGCACCWTSLSPSLLAASALGAWLITGGLGGEIVLLIATFPAILLLYGLHVSVRSKSLSLIVLTEFFWLGAFLSVFIAMCLEVLANALFYSSLLSCLPPLPTSTSSRSASSSSLVTSSLPSDSTSSSSFLSLSSSSFVPLSSSSSGDISEFLFSSSSDSIVKPPLLAPLSLPFYFPLIGYSSTEEDENRQRDCLSSSFFSSCPLKKNNKISSSSSQILSSSSSSSTSSAANKGEVQGGRKDRGKEQEEEREREQGNLAFSSSSSLAEGRVNAREMIPDFLKEREERTERDRREESWMDFLSKIASKEVSYLRHPLPTFLCSLGLVAFMICCVGLVEEFAKFVVLRRLKVVPSPSPPIWGGTVSDGAHDQNLSLLSHHVDAAGRAPPGGSDAEGGGGCGGFWSRYVKYPVGICLAGCAAGAGFAVAENLSYTLGRRGPFEEHLIVAIVRTFTAIPSHIANTGLAASTLAMSLHSAYSPYSLPSLSLLLPPPSSSPQPSSSSSSSFPALLPPFSSPSSSFPMRKIPSFCSLLFSSIAIPSLLHGVYDAALRLSAAFAQTGPTIDEHAATVAALFLLVAFLAWITTLTLFWSKWRAVKDLGRFGSEREYEEGEGRGEGDQHYRPHSREEVYGVLGSSDHTNNEGGEGRGRDGEGTGFSRTGDDRERRDSQAALYSYDKGDQFQKPLSSASIRPVYVQSPISSSKRHAQPSQGREEEEQGKEGEEQEGRGNMKKKSFKGGAAGDGRGKPAVSRVDGEREGLHEETKKGERRKGEEEKRSHESKKGEGKTDGGTISISNPGVYTPAPTITTGAFPTAFPVGGSYVVPSSPVTFSSSSPLIYTYTPSGNPNPVILQPSPSPSSSSPPSVVVPSSSASGIATYHSPQALLSPSLPSPQSRVETSSTANGSSSGTPLLYIHPQGAKVVSLSSQQQSLYSFSIPSPSATVFQTPLMHV